MEEHSRTQRRQSGTSPPNWGYQKDGTWREKSKTPKGCLLALIGLATLIAVAFVGGVIEENREMSRQKVEQAAIEERFSKKIDQHYANLRAAMDEGDFSKAVLICQNFRRYGRGDFKDVAALAHEAEQGAKVQEAYQTIRHMLKEPDTRSLDELDAALAACRTLLEQDANNTTATAAFKVFTDIAAVQIAEDLYYGPPPTARSWDGLVEEVYKYLKQTAHDPGSLEFQSWSKVYKAKEGWVVYCVYRGKNAFGATVRKASWFVIRQGRVVAEKPPETYSLK